MEDTEPAASRCQTTLLTHFVLFFMLISPMSNDDDDDNCLFTFNYQRYLWTRTLKIKVC